MVKNDMDKPEKNGYITELVVEAVATLVVLLITPFVFINQYPKLSKQARERVDLCEGKDPGVIVQSKLFESMKYTCSEWLH